MSKSIKKSSNTDRIIYYKNKFAEVAEAAGHFEAHDAKNENLQFAALEAIFNFGQQIRAEPEILEEFVRVHELPWNKVSRENPYNALIRLALPKSTKKAWASQCSKVLHFAHDQKINEHLRDWLKDGGISGRYENAVEHFTRRTTGKAGRSKELRLETAKRQLIDAPLTDALLGLDLNGEKPGFFRSLVYYDGTATRLVHVRDTPDDTATEKYLLDLVALTEITTHPLADKPLFSFFRAVDLITGSCGAASKNEERYILIWNETDEAEAKTITRLKLVSDAYTFAHASATLAQAVSEFDGKGPLLFSYSNAQAFARDFQLDDQWEINTDATGTNLTNNAKSPLKFALAPLGARNSAAPLRAGSKPTRRHKHFQCSIEQMRSLIANTKRFRKMFDKQNTDGLTSYPKLKRYQLACEGDEVYLELRELPNVRTSFLTFAKPGATFERHRDLSIEDALQICATLMPYGDDVTGYVANSDVEDAAICIDHSFVDGDRFECATPLVISVKMDRTQICDDLDLGSLPMQVTDLSLSANIVAPMRKHDYEKIKHDRLKNTAFPHMPYSCAGMFGAFITSYLPDDPHHRAERKFDFEWQLEWWRRMTDIPVHVIASNWTDVEIFQSDELQCVTKRGGRIIREPAQGITLNRNRSLTAFYASDFDWGIIMDDDAALMHGPTYNSGAALFTEITKNPSAYDAIDVFYPINPQKANSQGPLWKAAPELFVDNHVFDPEYDLKGSMYVVRNFRKGGRPEILLPSDFDMHGEDTLFAIEAISKGASVYRCGNMVLQELGIGLSHFPNRKGGMEIGNKRIAELYKDMELKMSIRKGSEHLLDRSDMLRKVGRSEDKRIIIEKAKSEVV